MEFIDRIPLLALVLLALFMLFAPFTPEPRLWEKFKMPRAGTLTRPLDIFDVFWHLAPSVLLAIKLYRSHGG